MGRKAAIYVRVSTDAQVEGYSIDAQKEQLISYCKAKGIKNYECYVDGGWSGSSIERPEIQKLISDIKAKKISHVIIYKLDRLSRSQRDTLYLIEDIFIPYDVSFISLTENLDTSTPIGKCMIGILSAFAQLERENIRMRTRMGMKERVKSGLWPGGATIPFGYDYDKTQGILVPNDDAEKVRQMYDLYLQGYSGQKIADMLNCKYDRIVTQILRRKSNYGIIEYNGEEYQGLHEPIISKEIYNKAMDEMLRRSTTRTTTAEHLLAGLIICGKCGAKMRYQKWSRNNDKQKLICYSQQTSKKYLIKDPNCDNCRPWADEVENEVLKGLFELKEDVEDVVEDEDITSVLDILNQQKEELEKKLKKLYLLYADSEDDLLLEVINENKKKLESINKQITTETEHKGLTENRKEVKNILSSLEDTWQYMTRQQRQHAVRLIVKRVTINDGDITVQLN